MFEVVRYLYLYITSVIQPSIDDNVNNIQGSTLDDPQLFSGALLAKQSSVIQPLFLSQYSSAN